MDLTATQYRDVVTYVENLYEGNLDSGSLTNISAIPWTDWMEVWMQSLNLESNLDRDCEISLRLTGDRQMQILNCQYRSIDKPTDVLAFAATETEIVLPPEMREPLYLGDIIISLDTASRQAQSQNHSLVTELAWLSSHGLLHLLGWDHPDDVSLNQMLQQQSELIQLLRV
ncbi:MAG: rRNA maturation RNase YbeY [Pleurocapsa sp.]